MAYSIAKDFEQELAYFVGRDIKEVAPEKSLKEDFGVEGDIFNEMILGFMDDFNLEINVNGDFPKIETVADLKKYFLEKERSTFLF